MSSVEPPDEPIIKMLQGTIHPGHYASIFHNPCDRCGGAAPHNLGIYTKKNGVRTVRGYCVTCTILGHHGRDQVAWVTGDLKGSSALDHALELGLPIMKNNIDSNYPCERCGSTNDGVERHHWAPSSIFKQDTESWPTSWLCRPCHTEWHHTTGLATGKPATTIPTAPWEETIA